MVVRGGGGEECGWLLMGAELPWIIEKAREFQKKKSTSPLLTMPKPLTVWITINRKILKEMGIPDHMTCLLRNLYTLPSSELLQNVQRNYAYYLNYMAVDMLPK